ncbi:TPA: minor capsid protein [Vibrio parahaemolyticus]
MSSKEDAQEAYDNWIKHEIYMRGQYSRINNEMQLFVEQMYEDIVSKITSGELTEYSKNHYNNILQEINELIDAQYVFISDALEDSLTELAVYQSSYAASFAVSNELLKSITTPTVLSDSFIRELIKDEYCDGLEYAEWISREKSHVQKEVKKQIRLGVTSGESNSQIMKRVVGTKATGYIGSTQKKTKANLEAIVRTYAKHANTQATKETFKKNGLTQYILSAVLDSRTTDTCKNLDGTVHTYGEKGEKHPPFHPNCRTTEMPYFEGVDLGETYPQWLARQPAETQKEALGAGKYKLYKQGMPISKFVDNNYNVMTLEQLKLKEGINDNLIIESKAA